MARSKFQLVFWSLASLGGIYAIFVALLANTWIQRNALYAHRFHTAWWDDLNKPESFGFAEGQVSPINITTPDGEILYAWHVLPLTLFAKNRERLLDEKSVQKPFEDSTALNLLKSSTSRLLINFHGNAGHLAQNWRKDALKVMPSCDPENIHVLTFDYRGFGHSSGEPSEEGLIADGVAVVDWALNTAKIPSERIVLLGQSLGTAVVAAVAEKFIRQQPTIEFAGLIMVSGFSDLPTLLKTYAIGGVIPILSPLNPYPRLQRIIASWTVDRWHTADRIKELSSSSRRFRLLLLHARSDVDIVWSHSDRLFEAAITGLRGSSVVDTETSTSVFSGITTKTAKQSKDKFVELLLLRHGGHNRITTSSSVALAVHRAFDMGP